MKGRYKTLRLGAIVESVKSEDFLIAGSYFSDLNDPVDSNVCALGSMIKNLPWTDFNNAISILSKKDTECDFLTLNSEPIQSSSLNLIADMLCNYYNCSLKFLIEMQIMNDSISTDERKEAILDLVYSRKFVEDLKKRVKEREGAEF